MSGPRIVICGAGIAGCAAAWQLASVAGAREVTLLEEGAPLSLTSDKSTECYRNWWPGPGPAMVELTNRSIDLMEDLAQETANRFLLNRRGYLFATASAERATEMGQSAAASCALGAGPLRRHLGVSDGEPYQPAPVTGFAGQPTGADLLTDRAAIHRHFPWLSPAAEAVLHVRRGGWLSAQQLGMLYLERARDAGARLLTGRLDRVHLDGNRVRAVGVQTAHGIERVEADVLVIAAGPYARRVGALAGVDVPADCEPHVKFAFDDHLGAVPRDAPLLLWSDPVDLPWSAEEREALASSPEHVRLLETLPAGVHGRPDGGGRQVLLYWTYEHTLTEPTFPLSSDPFYPEIAIRGMSHMLPALRGYFDALPKPYVDGGYYVKTPDNRPLIGPLGVDGLFAMTAFSGYGIMTSAAAGELLAAHVLDRPLPPFAEALAPARFDDADYVASLEGRAADGQI